MDWQASGEYTRHPVRDGRGDREDHDLPPGGPQRVPAADAVRAVATPSRPLGTTRRSASIVLTGEGTEAFCSGGDQRDPRRRRLRGRPRDRPAERAGPPGPDPAAAEAGRRDGRGLRDRRRARPAPGLRPDDRRRERAVRPDRAEGRLVRRRIRLRPAGAHGRAEAGEGGLVPLRAVRRARPRCSGAW